MLSAAKTVTSPRLAAARARRAVSALARPVGEFDASRYFRGSGELGFYNVGTIAVRHLAREIFRDHRGDWAVGDAVAFADDLIRDRYLEVKSVGIEVLSLYRRQFSPAQLAVWKRWLARNDSANWASTDAICGCLIGPLIVAHPSLAPRVAAWSNHRNLWVRRAPAVALIPPVRRGLALDLAYTVARALQGDREDLIQKAVGWMLREAGKRDGIRLERYLRQQGSATPRTTVRYAIERLPPRQRAAVLKATRFRRT